MKLESEKLLVKAERSLLAEACLVSRGLSYSSHAAVIAAFGKQFAKTKIFPVKYHRYLIDAQDQRNRGDYDSDPNLTKEDANNLIQQAEKILTITKKILDN